jgi:hypothetical protein
MVLYGLYKVFPVFPLSIICGIKESNFQHYKAAFFSFLILNVIEYFIYRKRITDISAFWYVRILTGTFAPWIIFLLWYISPAVYGNKLPSIPLEIIYANIITILAGYFALTLEQGLATMHFSQSLKVVTITLFVVSIILYMVFTFAYLPWADVFVEPNWR